MKLLEPGIYRGWAGCHQARVGEESAANALSGKYRDVDDLHCLYVQAFIVLLTVGMFVWLCLIPAVEASEQTILQKVVPPERQGRVFGFAQSVEQAASPLTAFMIGPIAQLIFIPFMTTGAGVDLLGQWFGTGTDRGLALFFTVTGLIGQIVTLMAMRTSAYRSLSANYQEQQVA